MADGEAAELAVERLDRGHASLIRLKGSIDESLKSDELRDGLPRTVVFDLDGVDLITSFGAREWAAAMRNLGCDYCGFINVRPIVMEQFNILAQFGGRGEIITFYLPYVCKACHREFEILLDLRKQYSVVERMTPPDAACPQCQSTAEFDDLPENYFACVAGRNLPVVPPAAALLIDTDVALEVPPLRVQQEVVRNVTALWLSGGLDGRASFKRLIRGLEGHVVVIAAHVVSVTAEGIEKLRPLIGAGVILARVSPVFLEGILKDPSARTLVRVASVEVSLRCEACEWRSALDVSPRTLVGTAIDEPLRPRCPLCGARVSPELNPELLEAMKSLPSVTTPAEVAGYLEERRGGPSVTPILSRGESSPVSMDAQTFGKYNLVKRIGQGGMAEVFLARQVGVEGFKKDVVIKRILPHLNSNRAIVDMFIREARLAARLNHPNIVQILDFGRTDDFYFLAMEYVKGFDLKTVIRLARRANMKMPVEVACFIAMSVSAALDAAHSLKDERGASSPVVHRDVTPHNILLSEQGIVKLGDFGIARVAGAVSETWNRGVQGKIGYIAPEVIDHELGPLDERADLFSLGGVLYECLTQETLFRRSSEAATVWAILNEPVPKVSVTRPDAPSRVDEILARTLAKDPALRYGTAIAVQKDLEDVIRKTGKAAGARELASWLEGIVGALAREHTLTDAAALFEDTEHDKTPDLIGKGRKSE